MSEIDPNTGLPLVPEGCFWRVEDEHWEWSENVPTRVHLMRHVELKSTRSRRRYLRNISYEVDESYDQVVFSQRIKNGELTKEVILATTEKIMNDWANLKARQALVGDYPPKKLES